jgi:hypothetical protein
LLHRPHRIAYPPPNGANPGKRAPLEIPPEVVIMGTSYSLRSAKGTMAARKAQVVMLQLRGGINTRRMGSWPPCTDKKIRRLWRSRDRVYRGSVNARQRRMRWLHEVKDPHLEFTRQLVARETKPSYALNLWLAFETTFTMFDMKIPNKVKAVTKKLRGDARSQNTTHPPAMTLRHLTQIVQQFRGRWPRECAVLEIAFVFGQRLPDMIQLSVANLREHSDSLVILVERGKVMKFKNNFILPVAWHLPYARRLLEARDAAVRKGDFFLLTKSNSESERRAATNKMRTMLRSVGLVTPPAEGSTIGGERTPRRLQVGSVRRGGLQRMAMAGFSLDRILSYSMHADIPMLLRYLDDGAAATYHRRRLRDPIADLYHPSHLGHLPEMILD